MSLSAEEIAARCVEDAQDAELFRVLAFTGIRIGEALALQVGDIELRGRRMIVQRAVSGTEEGPTKSWQVRYAKSRREDVDRLNLAFAVASHEADLAA